MADKKKLEGVDKAAILLMHLGEDLASEVVKHMSNAEMQRSGGSIVKRESISLQQGREVVHEFLDVANSGELAIEGIEFTKSFITKALGEDKAGYILDRIKLEMQGEGIESLKWMDPSLVANIIKDEHPQIIALILVHLDPEHAAQVLLYLPEDRVKGEVMLRIATLKRIPEEAVKDLEEMITEQMLNAKGVHGNSVEGVKSAAEILNQVESNQEGSIMEIIEKSSPDLAVQIQEMMFVFADLLTVDDRGLQQLVKELSNDVLTVALKGADEELMEKFLSNMSERAAEMLRDDIESMGPVKLTDVEKAQQEIVKIAKRLEQEGKIVRAGKGGDVLV